MHEPGTQERGARGSQGQRVPKGAPRTRWLLFPGPHPPNTVALTAMRWAVDEGHQEVKTKMLKMSVSGKCNSKATEAGTPPSAAPLSAPLAHSTDLPPARGWLCGYPHGPRYKGYGPFPYLRDGPFPIGEPFKKKITKLLVIFSIPVR